MTLSQWCQYLRVEIGGFSTKASVVEQSTDGLGNLHARAALYLCTWYRYQLFGGLNATSVLQHLCERVTSFHAYALSARCTHTSSILYIVYIRIRTCAILRYSDERSAYISIHSSDACAFS